ncbi:FHA domain-containing protein [Anaerosacchariphilus polymeriproducens]|uniref:FHA domain-containing protein n=1 Tax=Anaerosacchariphilus polymeriproducens TaxID=1812858 RepID=A0A371AZY9_9FIRM|nr:FHA domain-containing protein [Anaerosacchariphilus polymeriproducens]RDU25145.1 FHA domain-containing protein [Anaerosacchariphilus polymeriproducens]
MRGNNIIEYQDKTTLYYILMETELFDYIEYKVLNEQTEKGFIKCGRVLYNGKVKIVYNITGYTSLKWLLERGLSTEKFLEIMKLLFEKLKEVESIGYMHLWNVVLDFEKIFVDDNQKLRLIYRPLNINENYQTITALKKRLLSTILYYGYGGELIMRLQNVLRLETAQLNELCSVFRSDYTVPPNPNNISQETKAPVKHNFFHPLKRDSNAMNRGINNQGRKILKCRQENFSIRLDTEKKLLLGKQVTEHGVSIPFNPAISKLHAKIFEQNGEYYIVDLESKNGTYINGIRLVPIVAKIIRPGDTIRLANTDFDFVIE